MDLIKKNKVRKSYRYKLHAAKPLGVVQEPPAGPVLLLESSFILAYLDENDPNHKTAQAILGFVSPYNCRFHMPLVVSAEILSKSVHKWIKVSESIRKINGFIKSLPGSLLASTNLNYEELVNRYKMCARKDIKNLQGNDFLIVTEGILSNSMIVTCDHGMYKRTKPYYSDIYFVATDSKNYKEDASRFVNKFMETVSIKTKNKVVKKELKYVLSVKSPK